MRCFHGVEKGCIGNKWVNSFNGLFENDEIGLNFCNVCSNLEKVYCSHFKCFTEGYELVKAVRVVNITFRERGKPRNFRLYNIFTQSFVKVLSAPHSSSDVFNISINPSRDVFRTYSNIYNGAFFRK